MDLASNYQYSMRKRDFGVSHLDRLHVVCLLNRINSIVVSKEFALL